MDYEKRYNEALRRAKKLYEHGTITESLGWVFPEIKESKDERIRKTLIAFFRDWERTKSHCWNVNVTDIIAWLEKQQSFDKDKLAKGFLRSVATSIMNWLDANTSEGKMCLSNMECEDIENAVRNADWNKIYAYMRKKLEKQGEQPTDKVEPKFKVGDWIVLPLGIIAHIESLNSTDYQVTTTDGKICDFKISKQDNYRLWSITDAKNGDVLATEDGRPFIIRCMVESKNDIPSAYCGINARPIEAFIITGYSPGTSKWTNSKVHPATKEQRDLLFQKMKEAGYEWDTEKKEVKKIEPKTLNADEVIEWLKTNVFDDSAYGKAMIEHFKKDLGL